jgi:hypothetical protein
MVPENLPEKQAHMRKGQTQLRKLDGEAARLRRGLPSVYAAPNIVDAMDEYIDKAASIFRRMHDVLSPGKKTRFSGKQ